MEELQLDSNKLDKEKKGKFPSRSDKKKKVREFPKEVTALPGLLHKGAALTGYRLYSLGVVTTSCPSP